MVRKASHNRHVEIYDQELAGRPLVIEGIACADCGLPIVTPPILNSARAFVHRQCGVAPTEDEVAAHLLFHAGQAEGLTPNEARKRVTKGELTSAVRKYLALWVSIRDAAQAGPLQCPICLISFSRSDDLAVDGAGQVAHRRCRTDAVLGLTDPLLRSSMEPGAAGSSARNPKRPTRTPANPVAQGPQPTGDLHIRPPRGSEAGVKSPGKGSGLPGFFDDAVQQACAKLLRRLDASPPGRARLSISVDANTALHVLELLQGQCDVGHVPATGMGPLTIGIPASNVQEAKRRLAERAAWS